MADVTPMLIDGEAVETDEVAVVRSPFDGSELGRVPVGSEAHIDRAVAAALARHRAGALPAHQRAEILDRAAVAIDSRSEELARSISAEAAKPISAARVETQRCVDTFRFSAGVARSLTGEMVPMDASSAGLGKIGFTLRLPVGVVGAISPFNFPLNLVAHKVDPAIACGCPVVLKHASATPLTALLLARLLEHDAGLPPGWLNVVTCPGAVADRLVTHDDVAAISFTGSPPVGWGIRQRAPRKRVGLELGNNAPVIVHRDADLATAAAKVTRGGYAYSGQTCISVQRVYVHREVCNEFMTLLDAAVNELVVGDPADEATDVSALINSGETDRVESWIGEAVQAGATLRTGGTREQGLLRPTVLTDVSADMQVCRNEVFGPLVGVQTYSDIGEAFGAANDTRYGLQAGIFTNDLSLGIEAAHRLDFGGVCVNEIPTYRTDQMPYGGIKDSGNTKEGPAWSAREMMTEERMVVIQAN
ncbi:MAG: aldehyde dehydrogenase family protein [Microthrixaceae bacterium]|nr:aldehyde dehydrogenase family protein [Microthrixaceae bacterium]